MIIQNLISKIKLNKNLVFLWIPSVIKLKIVNNIF